MFKTKIPSIISKNTSDNNIFKNFNSSHNHRHESHLHAINKTIIQEELSDKDAIDLLLLQDMEMGKGIEMPINAFMQMNIVLIAHANIPDDNFKGKIMLCEIRVLARFFENDELTELIEMLKTETKS